MVHLSLTPTTMNTLHHIEVMHLYDLYSTVCAFKNMLQSNLTGREQLYLTCCFGEAVSPNENQKVDSYCLERKFGTKLCKANHLSLKPISYYIQTQQNYFFMRALVEALNACRKLELSGKLFKKKLWQHESSPQRLIFSWSGEGSGEERGDASVFFKGVPGDSTEQQDLKAIIFHSVFIKMHRSP